MEDDASNRKVMASVLRFCDAEVMEAASGKEALAALEQRSSFTLGLFDIQMADISGWQVLAQVRGCAEPSVRRMPVIAVTALAMQGDRERIMAAGFDGYIIKPIDVRTFVEQIVAILAEGEEKRNS